MGVIFSHQTLVLLQNAYWYATYSTLFQIKFLDVADIYFGELIKLPIQISFSQNKEQKTSQNIFLTPDLV